MKRERAEDVPIEQAEGETEEVDAVLVPAGEDPLPAPIVSAGAPGTHRGRRALAVLRSAPAVQAVAVAAGGFLAGAAVVGLGRRRRATVGHAQRRLIGGGRSRRGRKVAPRGADLLQVVGSRSFLVDVHLLAPLNRRR